MKPDAALPRTGGLSQEAVETRVSIIQVRIVLLMDPTTTNIPETAQTLNVEP